jgi:hypothetical protein
MAVTINPLKINKYFGLFDNMDKFLPFFKVLPEIGQPP